MSKQNAQEPLPWETVNTETGEVLEPEVVSVPATVEQSGAGMAANLFNAPNPMVVVQRAAAVASALADVIKTRQLYSVIQQRKYVRVEGWTLCGSMLGVFPVCVWSKPVEGGWEARVEARTMDGKLVGAAESQCTRSERTWAERDDYAIRSMAQTRATSKALRLPLGFIIQMAGYEATPAEEMPR